MADYRAVINNAKSTEDNSLVFFAQIQRNESDPPDWQPLPKGDIQVILPAGDVLTITEDDTLTDAEKRAAILDLFQAKVDELGIHKTTYWQVFDLLPDGFPVTVPLN